MPLTGSHPDVAGKPSEKHPGLFPDVMSVKREGPDEYKNGFKKPRTGRPAAIRYEFNNAIKLANAGAEQLVPLAAAFTPPNYIAIISTH